MEPEDVTWKTDMYCAAHINGVWERGQICGEISSSNTAEVLKPVPKNGSVLTC